jgi:DNA-directed RNA polymerase subunit RPC12/RpoP
VTPPDSEKERQRLLAYYASLTEGELRAIAADLFSLTDTAQQAVKDEMARRRLAVSTPEQAVASDGDPNLPWPSPPVTIRRFVWLADADIAKSILNSSAIDSFLADENIIRLHAFWSNAVGGVKLWVKDEDREEAIAILDSEFLETFHVEGIGEYKQLKCPACGSLDIYYKDRGGHNFLARWFFNRYPNTEVDVRCSACGNRWEETVQEPE